MSAAILCLRAKTSNVTPVADVPEDAGAVEAIDDVHGHVNVLTGVVGLPDALVTDSAELDCCDVLALERDVLPDVKTEVEAPTEK